LGSSFAMLGAIDDLEWTGLKSNGCRCGCIVDKPWGQEQRQSERIRWMDRMCADTRTDG
jgi:hypothetical protein